MSEVAPSTDRCPRCEAPLLGARFCALDGAVVAPFELATRYRVRDVLGAGASSLVFSALDLRLEQVVAVKLLRPGRADRRQRERFFAEARLASRLAHPSIVRVTDTGEDALHGVPFLVMERVEGPTLASVLERGPLEIDRARVILRRCFEAVGHAHERGVLHRDLKPGNILLEGDRPRIVDFGLSRRTGEAGVSTTGAPLGTPAYMSPEQVRGDRDQGPATDIYALGVLGYEMISGRRPHESDTPISVLAARLTEPPTPLSKHAPDVPRDLDRLVMRCLDPAADRRPSIAEALALLRGPVAIDRPREGRVVIAALLGAGAFALGWGARVATIAEPAPPPPPMRADVVEPPPLPPVTAPPPPPSAPAVDSSPPAPEPSSEHAPEPAAPRRAARPARARRAPAPTPEPTPSPEGAPRDIFLADPFEEEQ